MAPPRNGPVFQLLLHLATALPAAGVYGLFSAMANQLRYPSSHTHFFGSAMLALFEACPADKPAREVRAFVFAALLGFPVPSPALLPCTRSLARAPASDWRRWLTNDSVPAAPSRKGTTSRSMKTAVALQLSPAYHVLFAAL